MSALFSVTTQCAKLSETDDLMGRIHMITGKMMEDRLVAQDMIHKSQQKQKQRHEMAILNEPKIRLKQTKLISELSWLQLLEHNIIKFEKHKKNTNKKSFRKKKKIHYVVDCAF